VRRRWALVERCTAADGALVVSGSTSVPAPRGLTLVAEGAHRREFATHVEANGFSARLPMAELRAAMTWDLSLAGVRPWVAGPSPDPVQVAGDTEAALTPGDAALVIRRAGATVTGARWIEPGTLELTGRRRGGGELTLRARSTLSEYAFDVGDGARPGQFSARLRVAGVDSLAGPLPLPADTYDVVLRTGSPVVVAAPFFRELPAESVVDHKPFRIGVTPDGRAVLAVDRDLDADERGDRQQRRLRRRTYMPQRAEPLREAVVYSSFRGRQFSDSPRAIHEELVRRGARLEHLWVVRDGQCRVPATATAVREGSREHYEALARSRFVVCNDHFSEWFVRRDDKVSLQTWHGTPLKRLGFDVSEMRDQVRQFQHEWPRRVRNWQYVLSPNRFSTPILQRAYRIEGEMLELG
jgi:CDP-glycerol glycerophosphotransferase